jgi:hypothetical protein
VAVPILGKVLRFLFVPPRWEVVQLVGLQTLDLAILVRVQASQPIFSLQWVTILPKNISNASRRGYDPSFSSPSASLKPTICSRTLQRERSSAIQNCVRISAI